MGEGPPSAVVAVTSGVQPSVANMQPSITYMLLVVSDSLPTIIQESIAIVAVV